MNTVIIEGFNTVSTMSDRIAGQFIAACKKQGRAFCHLKDGEVIEERDPQ